MRSTPAATETRSQSDEDGLRAVLDGLRSIADGSDPHWRPGLADARAVVEDAWSALAAVLDEKPHAGAVLDLLRKLTVTDLALRRTVAAPRLLGEALARLESAPSNVADLVRLGPQLTRYLGFDRAIFSWVVDGVWISEAVYVVDDPDWADEINRVGREEPQRLVGSPPSW